MNTHLANVTKNLLCSRHFVRRTVLNEKNFSINVQYTRCLEIREQRRRAGHTDLAASSGTIWKAVCRGALVAWPRDPRETNPDILCSDLCFAIIC